ncbi:plastocyanin [Planktothrix agardhii]|uniref:Blue (type 1) copper domain-containing protein n=2 Tax=Planktothrix agardhii TaxID=1160 RepID=A0A073CDF7_PLAA1|nr:plastocyanin [Planktothrix agardhii]KEI66171.1 hypothetical protein A19Y_1058 [Planktothrix agardhii NIVA-CYA 126/8]CAD5925621.1 Plastocyanin [Planktothrix agardhii]CAD5948199.1 Plastocyanin [Planktothrix agardhii]
MNQMVSVSKRVALVLSVAFLMISTFVFGVGQASAETFTVKMGADSGMLKFDPSKVEAKPGDVVKFVNNKLPPHNVVFDKAKSPDADVAVKLSHKALLQKPGDSFEVAFTDDMPAGVYSYYCEPHRGAGMNAEIVLKK